MKTFDLLAFSQSKQNKKTISYTMNIFILMMQYVTTANNFKQIIIIIKLPRRHCALLFCFVFDSRNNLPENE